MIVKLTCFTGQLGHTTTLTIWLPVPPAADPAPLRDRQAHLLHRPTGPHNHANHLASCAPPPQILRPSVIVKLTYFTVNSMSLVGTSFEWQRDAAPAGPAPATIDASSLGERGGRWVGRGGGGGGVICGE